MTEEEQRDLNERRTTLEGEIREFQVRIHGLEKEAEHQLRHLDRQVVTNVLDGRYETIRGTYQDFGRIVTFLEHVRDYIVHHYKDFLPREGPTLPIPGLELRGPDMTRFLVHAAWLGACVLLLGYAAVRNESLRDLRRDLRISQTDPGPAQLNTARMDFVP